MSSTSCPLPRGVNPLDFSFKCICSLNDLQDEIPRPREGKTIKTRQVVEYVAKTQVNNLFNTENENSEKEEEEDPGFSETASNNSDDTEIDFYNTNAKSKAKELLDQENMEKVERDVYIATAIRLNNNTISDLSQLQTIMSKILVNFNWLAWIDLSFNDISTLDISFCEFPELRLIYLHGNSIESINQVDKLKNVRHLHTLTLHGNPVEMTENYRYHIISKLPELKSFDFSAVTKQERNLSFRRKFSNKKI